MQTPTPRRADFTVSPGALLGHVPSRAAKELVAAGLAARGMEAQFVIDMVSRGGAQPFNVLTVNWEKAADVRDARAFIAGALFALEPPDPLAADVRLSRNQWARLQGRSGRQVFGWTFCCGEPGCMVVAGVHMGNRERAAEQMTALGWQEDVEVGWRCPDHALPESEPAAAPLELYSN